MGYARHPRKIYFILYLNSYFDCFTTNDDVCINRPLPILKAINNTCERTIKRCNVYAISAPSVYKKQRGNLLIIERNLVMLASIKVMYF